MTIITLGNVETALLSRTKGKLAAAGMSVTTSNPDLIDPITTALSEMGIQVATFGALVDADIAQVPSDDIPELLDRAQLRVLMNVKGNLSRVDIRTARRAENFSQLEKELGEDIKALKAHIDDTYPPAADSQNSLQTGWLDLDFQANSGDEPCL